MQKGTILRKIREKRNYSQETMAYLLELSQSQYNKIESDKVKELSYKTIYNAMEKLDLDIEEIKSLLPESVKLHIEHNHTTNTTNGVNINKENPELWQSLLQSKEAELATERKLIAKYEEEIALLRLQVKELSSCAFL
jgi:transcriptional regulator with XRE-family HTH domain